MDKAGSIILVLVLALVSVSSASDGRLHDSQVVIDSGITTVSLILVIACIPINWRLRKLPDSQAWFCIVFSLLLNFIGNILKLRNGLLLGGPGNVPYPGISDLLFLLSYVLFGVALVLILKNVTKGILIKRPEKERVTLSIVVMSSIILGYVLYSHGYFENLIFDTLYLLLPLVNATLSLFIMEFHGGRKISTVWSYFAAGNIIWAFTRSVWTIFLVIGFIGQQILPSLIQLLGYVLYWLALHEQMHIIWLKSR